jgi:hypothetical protein
MNIEELAMQDQRIRIYGVIVEGLTLRLDKNSVFSGHTPVLVKGWSWKELCVGTRERRILLLDGNGQSPEGCGWLDPVQMWTVDRSAHIMALDVRVDIVERLLEASGHISSASVKPEIKSQTEGPIPVDESTAKRFEKFLSEESLFNTTAWVAHQSNNEL